MKQYRYIAMLVLITFIMPFIQPLGAAWAADPLAVEMKTNFTDCTAGRIPTEMIFKFTNLPTRDVTENGNVTTEIVPTTFVLTFPTDPESGITVELNPENIQFPYTISKNTVTIKNISAEGVEIPVKVKIDDTARTKEVQIAIKAGNNSITPVKFTLKVKPADINMKGSATPEKPRTNIIAVMDPYVEGQPNSATVSINLFDAFGNVSQTLPTGQTLYLWANAISDSNTLAEIDQATTTGFTVAAIDGQSYYKVSNIAQNNLTFKLKSPVTQLDKDYTFYVAMGADDLTKVDQVTPLAGTALSQSINMTTAVLNVRGENIFTSASEANPGTLRIALESELLTSSNNKVELKLPTEFKTNLDNEAGRIPITTSTVIANITQVPYSKAAEYKNGFLLYVNDKPYQLVKYDCFIEVKPSPLTAIIDNSLAFRRGTIDPIPKTLELSLSGMSDDITKRAERVVVKTSATDPVTLKVGEASGDFYQFEKSLIAEKEQPIKLSIPIEILGTIPNDIVYTIPITIETLNASNGIYENAEIELKYCVTDKIVNVKDPDTKIESLSDQTTSIKDEKTIYTTKTNIKLNTTELNGRGLYLWVERKDGGAMVKDQFTININGEEAKEKLVLQNTEIAVVEGGTNGKRNVFKVLNVNDGLDTKLALDDFGIQLDTFLPGEYFLKMATGRNASEAFATHIDKVQSQGFTLISTEQIPVITIANEGNIYDDKPYGKISFKVEKLTLKEGEVGQIILPDGFVINADETDPTLKRTISFTEKDKKGLAYQGTVALVGTPKYESSNKGIYTTGFGLQILSKDEEGKETTTKLDDKRINIAGCKIKITPIATLEDEITVEATLNGGNTQLKIKTLNPLALTVSVNKDNLLTGRKLLVWVTKADGTILTEGVTLKRGTASITGVAGKYEIASFENKKNVELQLQVDTVGSYKLHCVLEAPEVPPTPTPPDSGETTRAGEDSGDLPQPIFKEISFTVIDQSAPIVYDWQFSSMMVDDKTLTSSNNSYVAEDKKINQEVVVKAQLTEKDASKTPVKDQVVTISSSPVLDFTPQTVKTDGNGWVTFKTKATKAGTYIVNVTTETDKVTKAKATVTLNIKDPSDPSTPVVKDYYLKVAKMLDVVAVDSRVYIYLEVFDKDDEQIEITSNSMAEEIISTIRFRDTPDNSDLSSSHIYYQQQDKGIEVYFTPDYKGYYEIVITPKSAYGDSLYLDISAKNQGKIVEMELTYPEEVLRIGATSSRAILMTYDSEGVGAEKPVTSSSVTMYYSGNAAQSMDRYGAITVKNDDNYVGSSIKVTAMDDRLDLVSEYVFDIDDYNWSGGGSNNGNSSGGTQLGKKDIAIWDTIGGVDGTNHFDFYLVDENGFKVNLDSGQLSTNNGAKVSVNVVSKPYNSTVTASIPNNGRDLEEDGSTYVNLRCNKEGTVKLDISVKVYNPDTSTSNWKRYDYYNKRVEIEVKDAPVVSGNSGSGNSSTSGSITGNIKQKTVAMFIGSDQYSVNGVTRTMDAVPYVQNNRIMIPIRALADGLGAYTDFNVDTQLITIRYNGIQATMKVGSNFIQSSLKGQIYSDLPPVAKDNRTYVPLRAAAEALGCQVTTVSDINGRIIGAIFKN